MTEGEGPPSWPRRFDVSKWVLFAAYVNGRRAGGAAIAVDTPDLDMLEGRTDLAVLWDLRVAPVSRRSGIGSALFRAAKAWAIQSGCTALRIETQNVNVPACNLYAAEGCILTSVQPDAYRDFPDEIQLIWQMDLSKGRR